MWALLPRICHTTSTPTCRALPPKFDDSSANQMLFYRQFWKRGKFKTINTLSENLTFYCDFIFATFSKFTANLMFHITTYFATPPLHTSYSHASLPSNWTKICNFSRFNCGFVLFVSKAFLFPERGKDENPQLQAKTLV